MKHDGELPNVTTPTMYRDPFIDHDAYVHDLVGAPPFLPVCQREMCGGKETMKVHQYIDVTYLCMRHRHIFPEKYQRGSLEIDPTT